MAELELDVVRHALRIAHQKGFAEVEIGSGSDSFRATLSPRDPKQKRAESTAAANPDQPNEIKTAKIVAPLVGYFQSTSPPLAIGQTVSKKEIVGVISALGIANDVESTVAGEVVEVLVSPGQALEYGQTIAILRPEL